MKKSGLVVMLGLLACLCAGAATPSLQISSGVYGTSASFDPLNPGVLTYNSLSFPPGWTLSIRAEVQPVGVLTPGNPVLDLFIQATSASGSASGVPGLYLNLSAYNFAPISGSFQSTVTGSVTSGTGSSLFYGSSYQSFDPHLGISGPITTLASSGPLQPTSYFSISNNSPISLPGGTLTESLSIGGAAPNQPGATYSIEATLMLIPEPSCLSLVTCGTIAMFWNRRRRKVGSKNTWRRAKVFRLS